MTVDNVRAGDNEGPPPDWVVNLGSPELLDPEFEYIAIKAAAHPRHRGSIEMYSTSEDPVMHLLVAEGLAEALRHVLVAGGYVMDADAPGGWRAP